MAVEHVRPGPGLVVRLDGQGLTAAQPDDVLETGSLVGHHGVAASGAGEDLEVDQVDVDGVRPTARVVLKLPDLNSAEGGFGQDTVVDVREDDLVNLVLAVGTLELEVAVDDVVLLRREGHLAEGGGDSAGILNGSVADKEAHDLEGVSILVLVTDVVSLSNVAQVDGLATVGGEINDDLVTLSHGDVHVSGADGFLQKTGVASNDLEGNTVAGGVGPGEVQEERAGDGRVQEAEAVLAGLDVEEGPRLAVDMDDIAPAVTR